jgi:hypothetical protein
MMLNNGHRYGGSGEPLRDIFDRTDIRRKPICGIVSGYHDLPYIMVASVVQPESGESGGGGGRTAEITGRICVSPKFVISMDALAETFGDVFEPDTFDSGIEGRIFSFAGGGAGGRNVKVESKYFNVQYLDEPPRECLERVEDMLMSREDTRTGLIFSPDLRYYPVSIDKFISEIIDREFRV